MEIDKVAIRPIHAGERELLEDFIYNAIFLPPGAEPVPREIIFDPEIYIYVEGFDPDANPGDLGFAVMRDAEVIGAAWTRIIPAYGHIDERTPELAISVLSDDRGQGIGAMLMARLFAALKGRGFSRTSLSVQKDNPAVRFYPRLGYEITGEKLDHADNEDWLMVKEL